MRVIGNRVTVDTLEQYEQLLRHPDSVEGVYDPALGIGQVWFSSVGAAQAAYNEGV